MSYASTVLLWFAVAPMIAFAIEPVNKEYLLRQKVRLAITLTNEGSEPVEVSDPTCRTNLQPEFALRVPAAADEEEPKEPVVFGPNGYRPAAPVERTLMLGPGATWTGELELNGLCPLNDEGEYEIEATLALQDGKSAKAPKKTFVMKTAQPYAVHHSEGVRPFGAGLGIIVFLQGKKESASVFKAQYNESEPHNLEVRVKPMREAAGARENATDILTPWLNAAPFSDLIQWMVWREGKSVLAMNTIQKAPASVELPSKPDFLVRPPLQTAKGPVEVLALDGKALTLVVVPKRLKPVPTVGWTQELPEKPKAITAILGPEELGSVRHLAFATVDGGKVRVFHGTYSDSGLGKFESAEIAGLSGGLLPGSPLAVAATGDGVVHIAVLGRKGSSEVVLGSVQFGVPDKPEPVVAVKDVGKLEQSVTASDLNVVTFEGKLLRIDAAVQTADGETWNVTEEGKLAQVSPKRKALPPFTIVTGRDVGYLLCTDEVGAFHMQPLNR
ncbi:hypothetical protein F183_A10750 [Bryobacterales bacterium F-183]|nr:hypothetical protein F183_A10750 [Bryobacterales bacterium F-183]